MRPPAAPAPSVNKSSPAPGVHPPPPRGCLHRPGHGGFCSGRRPRGAPHPAGGGSREGSRIADPPHSPLGLPPSSPPPAQCSRPPPRGPPHKAGRSRHPSRTDLEPPRAPLRFWSPPSTRCSRASRGEAPPTCSFPPAAASRRQGGNRRRSRCPEEEEEKEPHQGLARSAPPSMLPCAAPPAFSACCIVVPLLRPGLRVPRCPPGRAAEAGAGGAGVLCTPGYLSGFMPYFSSLL